MDSRDSKPETVTLTKTVGTVTIKAAGLLRQDEKLLVEVYENDQFLVGDRVELASASARSRFLKGLSPSTPSTAEEALKAVTADFFLALSQNRESSGQASGERQELEPWPQRVDGEQLLTEIAEWLRGYVVLPEGAAETLATYVVLTYSFDHFDLLPYLLITSATKRCGKSRLMALLSAIVRAPWLVTTPSAAVLYRKIERDHPTVLYDEAGSIARPGETTDVITDLLNSGFERGAKVPRCEKGRDGQIELREFDLFGPKVFALVGKPRADALEDRCIVIRLKRRARNESVARLRRRLLPREAESLRRQLVRWTLDHGASVPRLDVPPPGVLDDRGFDLWEPLLQIGCTAGVGWGKKLMAAARMLSGGRDDEDLGTQLLADIRLVFQDQGPGLTSRAMVDALKDLDSRPWAELGGKGLTTDKLARMLKPFEVAPTKSGSFRGYALRQFTDAFTRWLPAESGMVSDPSAGTTPVSRDINSPEAPETLAAPVLSTNTEPALEAPQGRGEDPEISQVDQAQGAPWASSAPERAGSATTTPSPGVTNQRVEISNGNLPSAPSMVDNDRRGGQPRQVDGLHDDGLGVRWEG
jgi:hypothetical protein